MLLHEIELHNFRNYSSAKLGLSPGVTVVVGANGQGKTNLLEAIGFVASLSSFRGASDDVLIRDGATSAIVRATGEREGRELLIEVEINRVGRNRTMVNRQPLKRSRDLLGALRATVFAPDDLELVKGGPGGRRAFIDELAVALDPACDTQVRTFERVLRQRNALLKQTKGRLSQDVVASLDVWDSRLIDAGAFLAELRHGVVNAMNAAVTQAYAQLSNGSQRTARIRYAPIWESAGFETALREARDDDVRRGVTTVGPHRDDVALDLGDGPARSHGSQGEQRSFALALRLAGHRLVTERTGSPPILLLDDVFSELDEQRRRALFEVLPAGQTLITSAADIPNETNPDARLLVSGGSITSR